MKRCVLLSLLLALGCTYIRSAPVEDTGVEAGSCEDPQAKGAAQLALTKINQDRKEGYVFGLHKLSNVHLFKHGETGVVFYLTLDVVETNCSILSKKDWKSCEIRPFSDTPVYGQCKAAIYINKPHRVVRLYKYDCVVRPVPAEKVSLVCPDCPMYSGADDEQVKKTLTLSLEKFNKDSGLGKHFALLKFERALVSMGIITLFNVEYTIQETICPKSTEGVTAEKCPLMDCEFAHKGFCKGSLYIPSDPTAESEVNVDCEIFEPEAAERQKKLHLLGGETDHSHTDTHAHNPKHDQVHPVDDEHTHDHVHDHTKSHAHHDKAPGDGDHHHTHDHAVGSGHRHAHDHSHDHGHGHDHMHTHHAKAHDHSGDSPMHHHDYKHADGVHTHEHDHELAEAHDHAEGMVRLLPAMAADLPMILPSFPDVPAGPEVGVVLPLKQDPQIPGALEPTIEAFPKALSAQCSAPLVGATLVDEMFTVDATFKAAA
uniref:Cystatin fetuin-B-type domain-containing protein n=1 Tax=Tetraodon nigroviridis TaxID=99883 RepID=H3C9Q1_TETNG